jgi:hypothetical protein
MPVGGYVAGGNIKARRFVQLNSSGLVVAADSNSATLGIQPPIGVSQPNTRYAPGTPWDDGYAATATAGRETLFVFDRQDQICEIEIGDTSANQTIAIGDLLAPSTDASGRAVKASTLVTGVGAITGISGATGNIKAGLMAAGHSCYYGARALEAVTTTAGADGTATPKWIKCVIEKGVVLP